MYKKRLKVLTYCGLKTRTLLLEQSDVMQLLLQCPFLRKWEGNCVDCCY